MKQVTITKIERKDEVSKRTGKSYERIYIWTDKGGDLKISGFGDVHTDQWKEGSTVTIDIKQVGNFWNFYTTPQPEKIETGPTDTEMLHAKLQELHERVHKIEEKLREKTGVEKVFDEMGGNDFQEPLI